MMAVVKASSADVDLMARLLRAEAEGEGKQGNAFGRQCGNQSGAGELF